MYIPQKKIVRIGYMFLKLRALNRVQLLMPYRGVSFRACLSMQHVFIPARRDAVHGVLIYEERTLIADQKLTHR
jgi:hypothetical protein